jgi:hypothetical protein
LTRKLKFLTRKLKMPVIYTAVSSFDPTHGDDWTKYVKWSGLTQLTEVVSLDSCLCPSLVPEIIDDDWNYCVNEDYKTNYFTDCDYLIGRLESSDRMGILALMENPTEVEVESFRDNRFEFRRFDLVELQT